MAKAPPELPGSPTAESPADRALALSLANEKDTALRWAAAIVAADPAMPSGLLLTGRLLADLGRAEGAREAFEVCVVRAIDSSQLPLAVAACSDLRTLGSNASKHFDAIADAFAKDSPRLGEGGGAPAEAAARRRQFHPLASVLTGPALLGKATEIVHAAKRALDEALAARAEPPHHRAAAALLVDRSRRAARDDRGLRGVAPCRRAPSSSKRGRAAPRRTSWRAASSR